MMEMLVAENVWKVFGKNVALADVSLSLGKGLHLVLGPNGSGKTTLLKLWSGLIRPNRGRVLVKGLDPWKHRCEVTKFLSAVFEDQALPWWVSGREFMEFVAKMRNVDVALVKEYAHILGVDSYWHRAIRTYSSGMRKKLLLLMAFATTCEILLLDEPYTLLDKRSIEVVNELVLLKLRDGCCIVIATHVFGGIERFATSVTILHNGKVLKHIDVNNVRRYLVYECCVDEPKNLVTKLLDSGITEFEVKGKCIRIPSNPQIENLIDTRLCRAVMDVGRLYESTLVEEEQGLDRHEVANLRRSS